MASEPQKTVINISTATLLKIIGLGLALFALFLIRDVLLLLLVSMILASAMDPLVDWLYRKAKFPRGLSVVLVYLVFIIFVVGIFYFLIPPMVEQFSQLASRLESVRQNFSEGGSVRNILDQLGVTSGFSALASKFSEFTSGIFNTTLGVFSGAVQVVAVLAISFYLISSESGMKNLIKSLVPYKHRPYAVSLTGKIQNKISRWLLGQLILSAFIFLLTFIGLTILGVKSALALALLAGLLEIVPYLGPILSAVPAVFVAFVQSPPLALFVIVLYVIVQQLENYILVPKIMGRTVGANPVVILLALLIGFQLAGIIGMLVAVPVVAAVGAFLSDFREAKEQSENKES